MPAFAKTLAAYDSTFYSKKEPSCAAAGELTGISDIYYYYDPIDRTLVVKQTEWIGDGAGGEYNAPYASTFYYTDVTFDNMCQTVGYCDDTFQSIIGEMRTEYEDYLNNSKDNKGTGTPSTLKNANDYTDKRFDALEKKLSTGIASSTAMSSIEVSNVRKGEMSVGGGYGYYNSRSAIAFGAALGLTDQWSVNTAAGLANSSISFRAGTNYKFKLF